MTNNFEATAGVSRPPRYLWRRAAAFVIDVVAFYLILVVVAWLAAAAAGWDASVALTTATNCAPAAPSALTEEVDREWPLHPGETRINQLCVISPWPGKDKQIFISTVSANQATSNITRNVSIGVDENGNMIPLRQERLTLAIESLFQLAAASMFIFALAKITSTGRRSLGKAWMSLRIVATDGSTPSFGRCLKREISKFLLPILAPIALSAIFVWYAHTAIIKGDSFADLIRAAQNMQLTEFMYLFVVQAVLSFAAFVWLFGAFLRWRGQTFYDRLVGCFVVRQ